MFFNILFLHFSTLHFLSNCLQCIGHEAKSELSPHYYRDRTLNSLFDCILIVLIHESHDCIFQTSFHEHL